MPECRLNNPTKRLRICFRRGCNCLPLLLISGQLKCIKIEEAETQWCLLEHRTAIPSELQPGNQDTLRLRGLRRRHAGNKLPRPRVPGLGVRATTQKTQTHFECTHSFYWLLKAFFLHRAPSQTPAFVFIILTPDEGGLKRQLCHSIWFHCCSWFGLCTLPCRRLRRRLPYRLPRTAHPCAGLAGPAPTPSSWGSALCLVHLCKGKADAAETHIYRGHDWFMMFQ